MPETQKLCLYRAWWSTRNDTYVNPKFQTLTKAQRFAEMTGEAMSTYHERPRRERAEA